MYRFKHSYTKRKHARSPIYWYENDTKIIYLIHVFRFDACVCMCAFVDSFFIFIVIDIVYWAPTSIWVTQREKYLSLCIETNRAIRMTKKKKLKKKMKKKNNVNKCGFRAKKWQTNKITRNFDVNVKSVHKFYASELIFTSND